ncbi:MAG: epoxyqueuosine reductase [Bacillota bacterium]|nr:epoxyqueuosine reductase [Bacillota bacterium]MDW7684486.1 epoxyqueuosine reductase [Bacillota bacterium]
MNKEISEQIKNYVKNYQRLFSTESNWLEPCIGFSSTEDPLFQKLQEWVSPSHALPTDFISDAKSVIAFFLPFHTDIVASNIGGIESSREWDIANIETNNLIVDISRFIFLYLQKKGYTSTILPPTYNYDEKKLISDWSHRHVGYIAGIGTFGIHNMFITERGCCGRMGSIITNLPLEPTKRSTAENCLYKYNGSCKKCVNNCVASAIYLEGGHPVLDKKLCYEQIYNHNIPQYPIGIGDACGKCMCNTPCSRVNPVRALLKTAE